MVFNFTLTVTSSFNIMVSCDQFVQVQYVYQDTFIRTIKAQTTFDLRMNHSALVSNDQLFQGPILYYDLEGGNSDYIRLVDYASYYRTLDSISLENKTYFSIQTQDFIIALSPENIYIIDISNQDSFNITYEVRYDQLSVRTCTKAFSNSKGVSQSSLYSKYQLFFQCKLQDYIQPILVIYDTVFTTWEDVRLPRISRLPPPC